MHLEHLQPSAGTSLLTMTWTTRWAALLAPPIQKGMSGSRTLPCLWMPALLHPHSQVPTLAARHLLPSVSVAWVQPAGNIWVGGKISTAAGCLTMTGNVLLLGIDLQALMNQHLHTSRPRCNRATSGVHCTATHVAKVHTKGCQEWPWQGKESCMGPCRGA